MTPEEAFVRLIAREEAEAAIERERKRLQSCDINANEHHRLSEEIRKLQQRIAELESANG